MAGYGVEKLILFWLWARNEATEVSDRNYPLVPLFFILFDKPEIEQKKIGRGGP